MLFEENGIRPLLPTVEKDLPGGARRLVQKAEGINATSSTAPWPSRTARRPARYAGQVLKGKLAS